MDVFDCSPLYMGSTFEMPSQENKGDLDKMTDTMEYLMEKQPIIASITVAAFKETERSQVSQTVYRKGNDLLIDRRSEEQGRRSGRTSNKWTSIFKNCLSDSWIFGYYFAIGNDSLR
ncbi:hypothetical protein RUM43_009073 [Polyplax serrata]|uniref:Uncharacterized protein n=1 Tax=Polyplax serrata TaxID=468196 RepID=A0AAN8S0X6_POLSC